MNAMWLRQFSYSLFDPFNEVISITVLYEILLLRRSQLVCKINNRACKLSHLVSCILLWSSIEGVTFCIAKSDGIGLLSETGIRKSPSIYLPQQLDFQIPFRPSTLTGSSLSIR